MNCFQKIDDKKEWQRLLGKVLFKTFFHTLDWEEFLEHNFQWLKFERYLYKDKIVLSLARYKVFGKEKLISHPFCEYGGPLPLKDGINGREFKKHLFEYFKMPFKISIHPEIPKYFQNFGLKEPDSTRDTYFIENIHCRDLKEIYSSFRKTLRHSIKKAESQNTLLKRCENEEELRGFYNLYLKSSKRHKTIPYPFSFFKYFLNNANTTNDNSNGANIVLAKFKNKIIAGSVFLFYGKYIHYFLNASDEKFKEKRANYLILWNQIKEHIGKGYKIFDFGGTGRGSSLEIFKKGWGTRRYPIFELKNFSEGKLGKSKLRNIINLVPSFLLEKFSVPLLRYKL